MDAFFEGENIEVKFSLESLEKVNSFPNKWAIRRCGKDHVYCVGHKMRDTKLTVTYLHRLITDCPKGLVVDHINRDTLDNRTENLRITNNSINSLNTKSDGVGYRKEIKKWRARISVDGKEHFLGHFDTKEEAMKVRKEKEIELGITRPNQVKLAITGPIRSGKDSIKNYAHLFYDFYPFAFADEGKALVHRLFPNVPRDPKPRKYYQEVIDGITKLPVEGAADVWINGTLRDVDAYIKRRCCSESRVMITDVRKPREFEVLRQQGYTIIRVTAPLSTRLDRARQAGDAFEANDFFHDTERHIGEFTVDYEIHNDGSLNDLYAKFDVIMRELNVEKAEGMGDGSV